MGLKKAVLYCLAASILGIIVILGPLFALAASGNGSSAVLYIHSASERLQKLEEKTYGSDASAYSSFDLEILTICFVVALAVYLLVKRARPYSETAWFRRPY